MKIFNFLPIIVLFSSAHLVHSAPEILTYSGKMSDGKYPNFGTSIPNAEQIGRVNFIKNVSSGGNLMNNRQSFDQFGGNISIGKVALP